MKITVKYDVSQHTRTDTYDVSDFGLSDEEWNDMSDDEKNIVLMDMVENDRPYWTVDSINEKDKIFLQSLT